MSDPDKTKNAANNLNNNFNIYNNPYQNCNRAIYMNNQPFSIPNSNQNSNTKFSDDINEKSFNTQNEISMIIPNYRKNDCLHELLEK